MVVPFDWMRVAVPGPWFTSFFGSFSRTSLRAAFDLALLVGAIELMRLCCFCMLHANSLSSPKTMAEETVESWPDSLVVSISRPDASSIPELSINQPLPFDVRLPTWLATSLNLALSYMMRSAVQLDFLPERPLMLFAVEENIVEAVAAATKRAVDQNIFIVLTKRWLYIAYASRHAPAAEDPMPALSYSMLERLGQVVCEPFQHSHGIDGTTLPDDGRLHFDDRDQGPDRNGGAGAGRAPRGEGGFSCRKRHLSKLVGVLAGSHGALFARVFRPGVMLAMHLACWVFAYAEAFFGALLVTPALLLGAYIIARPLGLRQIRASVALPVALYAQTLPLLVNGFIDGPLHHWAAAEASAGGGGGAGELKWSLDGVEAPVLPSPVFFTLHLALALLGMLHVLSPPGVALYVQRVDELGIAVGEARRMPAEQMDEWLQRELEQRERELTRRAADAAVAAARAEVETARAGVAAARARGVDGADDGGRAVGRPATDMEPAEAARQGWHAGGGDGTHGGHGSVSGAARDSASTPGTSSGTAANAPTATASSADASTATAAAATAEAATPPPVSEPERPAPAASRAAGSSAAGAASPAGAVGQADMPSAQRLYVRLNAEQYWAHAEKPLLLRQALFEQQCTLLYASALQTTNAQLSMLQEMQQAVLGACMGEEAHASGSTQRHGPMGSQ
jgi:hypothetical protein